MKKEESAKGRIQTTRGQHNQIIEAIISRVTIFL